MNLGDKELQEFILDSEEVLDKIESTILLIEKSIKDPTQNIQDSINTLFRYFHTLKGTSGFFQLPNIVKLSHSAESLLDFVRTNSTYTKIELLDLLMEAKDSLNEIFQVVKTNKNDSGFEEKVEILSAKLLSYKSTILKTSAVESLENKKSDKSSRFGVFKKKKIELDKNIDEPKVQQVSVSKVDEGTKKTEEVTKKDIRIETEKLDFLLEMIGELVIAESLVTQNPDLKNLNLENFHRQAAYLKKIVRNLQEVSLQLRMIPMEGLFHKMERLTRDLSHKTNKKVDIVINGSETDIDKSILELLTDPMVHILRNAIDHGIESEQERVSKGKSPIGKIFLEARHTGNEVWITISDDGRGLDKERIFQIALDKNQISGTIDMYKDNEIYELIFLPGLTTRDTVTDISGRGVGMDIVRKNLTKLSGDIEILSTLNKGTQFVIKLPLTIAIIEGMVVKYKDKHYIIPTIDVKETHNLKELKLESIHKKERVIRYRDRLVPILNIHGLLKTDFDKNEIQSSNQYLIVVESRGNSLGIVFDDILGNHSIVIKPVPEYVNDIKGFSGCTILGNGNIGMILDIKYLILTYYQEKSN